MPGRTVGYPWTLIYSTDKHGFSLKTLYRDMAGLESPILIAVKDTNDNVRYCSVINCFHIICQFLGCFYFSFGLLVKVITIKLLSIYLMLLWTFYILYLEHTCELLHFKWETTSFCCQTFGCCL